MTNLRAEFVILCLAIFGSYTSGKFTFGSDIDLLIVHNDSKLSFEKCLGEALNVSTEIDWEIHLYSLKMFKNALKEQNDFLLTILEDNINIYQSKEFKIGLYDY